MMNRAMSVFAARAVGPAAWVLLSLGVLAATLLPLTASAQDGGASCNPELNVGLPAGPFFLNQPITISADLGAGQVVGGTLVDISTFSYALDCQAGQGFTTCTSDGNTVVFSDNIVTDCVDESNNPVTFTTVQNGVFIDFTAMSGEAIRILSNATCNVQFDITVTALNGLDNTILQAMGWDAPDAVCNTSPPTTNAASATLAFNITVPPQLTLVKQVINDNGGTNGATEWTLTASGEGGFSGPGVGDQNQAVNGPNDVIAGVSYTLSESGPSGYDTDGYTCAGDGVFNAQAQTITLQDGESATCTIVNDDIGRARFAVTKDFSDDNPLGVEVQISCNTGLPLEQSKVITEFDGGVVFVVGDFEPGTMDCDVTEVVPDGYAQNYQAGAVDGMAGAISADENGCHYDDILGGLFTCNVTNTLLPVDVVVNKVWIDEHPEFLSSNIVEVLVQCDSEIIDGFFDDGFWFIQAFIDPANPGEFLVFPLFTGTTCVATEEPIQGVDTDQSDCENMQLFPGIGDSCVIFNTRLFAGIPTLGQHGLLLLALLLLAVGFVAYRRVT